MGSANQYASAASSVAKLMGGVGSLVSGLGNRQAGNAAYELGIARQQQENYSADVLQQQATAVRGQASSTAADTALGNRYLLSTVRARAAASGGGATDPTVVNVESQIAGRGEYNTLSALYSGEERARGMENQASLDRYMGQQDLIAGQVQRQSYNIRGLSTALSGASTLFAKYGGGGFTDPSQTGGGATSYGGGVAPDIVYGGGVVPGMP